MCTNRISRRRFLAGVPRLGVAGFLVTPLAGLLSACQDQRWPVGMADIKWDRDTCTRCHMVISDRRFAAELRGGNPDTVFKFDDVGCLVFWMQEQAGRYPWMSAPGIKAWVADFNSRSRDEMTWLDPFQARYIPRTSPMGYGFAGLAANLGEGIDFESMRQRVLARGK